MHLFDSTLLAMAGSREQTVLPTKCLQLLRDVRTLAGGRVADGTQRQLFQVLVGRMVVFAAKLRVGIAKALRLRRPRENQEATRGGSRRERGAVDDKTSHL